MRPVKGFMTADGTFYDSDVDARLHEAVQTIKALCDSHKPKPIPADRLLTIIANWSQEISEFINARQAKDASLRPHQEDTSAASGHQADDSDGDALDAAVVEQPAGGSEYVFKMGVGTSSKSVQPSSKKYGP